MIVFVNGRFADRKDAKVSTFDHGFLYADGVYETLRTYDGKVWQTDEHLCRLLRSAEMIGLDIPWSLKQMGSWIVQTVRKNGFEESRIRMTVTRGQNNFDFGKAKKPTICIQVQKLKPQPARIYSQGVPAVSYCVERTLPEAKTLNLLPMAMAQRFMLKHKAYEALMVNGRGCVTEGTVMNVFMVKDGVLVTPNRGMLAGTTRDVILKIARKMRLKVDLCDIKLTEMYRADEIFISNAPRGIVPVVRLDGKKIGTGRCGPVTRGLMKAFDEYVQALI